MFNMGLEIHALQKAEILKSPSIFKRVDGGVDLLFHLLFRRGGFPLETLLRKVREIPLYRVSRIRYPAGQVRCLAHGLAGRLP